jgi:hypothetical protein
VSNGTATDGGILFGPNASGKRYVSLYIHRPPQRKAQKSAWHPDVTPLKEYGIFCVADDSDWRDAFGDYWGLRNGGDVLGATGERICTFPRTSNAPDPWHGYPVSPMLRGDVDSPPDAFIDAWINSGVVTLTFGRRLQRRKV